MCAQSPRRAAESCQLRGLAALAVCQCARALHFSCTPAYLHCAGTCRRKPLQRASPARSKWLSSVAPSAARPFSFGAGARSGCMHKPAAVTHCYSLVLLLTGNAGPRRAGPKMATWHTGMCGCGTGQGWTRCSEVGKALPLPQLTGHRSSSWWPAAYGRRGGVR